MPSATKIEARLAAAMHLSKQTVKNHIHCILGQENPEDRYQAVETIRLFGLLS